MPPSVNESNVKHYRHAKTVTDYHEFPGRSYYTVGQDGWEEVADYALESAMGEFPEISRIVVSLAAIIRSAIDADRRYYESVSKEALDRQVGILFPDKGDFELQEPLRFREACNKIIHADLVNLETAPDNQGPPEPLTGRLNLDVHKDNKEWCAELDLKAFALSALSLSP
jgi:hypothetical protein